MVKRNVVTYRYDKAAREETTNTKGRETRNSSTRANSYLVVRGLVFCKRVLALGVLYEFSPSVFFPSSPPALVLTIWELNFNFCTGFSIKNQTEFSRGSTLRLLTVFHPD